MFMMKHDIQAEVVATAETLRGEKLRNKLMALWGKGEEEREKKRDRDKDRKCKVCRKKSIERGLHFRGSLSIRRDLIF